MADRSVLAILRIAPSLDAVEPAAPVQAHILDAVWHALNALGGTFDPSDREAAARDAMLGQCIAVVERMGGRDPLARDREAA